VDGMTRADEYILRLLDDADIAANPVTIAFNTGYNNSYVAQRCRAMADAGLVTVESDDQAMYSISQLGRRYVRDNLSAQEIREIEDELTDD